MSMLDHIGCMLDGNVVAKYKNGVSQSATQQQMRFIKRLKDGQRNSALDSMARRSMQTMWHQI